jgi:carotenoid cleavage dioxygenase-like enzyme
MRRPIINPYLSGGFEPIRMECDYGWLEIEGELPAALDGTFYRAGPNPQFEPRGSYNPLQGDGMVHAFHISGGRVSYRNRWVRTRRWLIERQAGRALFGTSGDPADTDPSVAGVATDGAANTNVVWHGGRLLALEEGHAPIELDPSTLTTLGGCSFGGRLARNMTAHPKLDPETGEMWLFANMPGGGVSAEVVVHAVDATGRLFRSERIETPFPALIHDFAVTQDFVILPVFPVTVSLERLRAGGPPIAWEPGRGVHVAVIPKAGGTAEARWFAAPTGMAWHVLNAFNDGAQITLDLCVQEAAMFPSADGAPPDELGATQRLARWTWDWTRPTPVAARLLDDLRCEYPRIDERRTGLRHRYAYVTCLGGPGSGDPFHRGLARFDLMTGERQVFSAGERCAVGEPVFVPAHSGAPEGEGFLLSCVFDELSGHSCLAIFDAERVADGPVARARLQHRVPMGFHAAWKPGAAHVS